MIRVLLAFVFALAAAPAVAATAPRALDIGPGAQVWFQEDHTVPMVAFSIALPAGSVYDPDGKAGLAAFAAYMFNEGAGDLRSVPYQAELANRAIQLNLTPQRDYFVLSVQTLSSSAADAARLIALALQKPRFDADAIARVRAQMLQAIQQNEQDPEQVAAKRFFEVYFAGHPYAHPVDGTVAGLNAIAPADLKSFAAAHWTRGGARIAVAGDIDAATLGRLLHQMFDGLPATPPPAPPPVKHAGGAALTVVDMPVPQPNAVFGLPGMLRSDPDYLAGYVANQIVGGGDFSARLTNEVREKRGLTYGISTDLDTLQLAGLVTGQVATRRESMTQSLSVIRDVLAKFAAEGPTDAELRDAKTYLTGSYPLAFASNTGIAAQLNTFQRAGLPLSYVARRNGLIDKLTLADVKRAAARLFDPKRMTVVVAGTIAGPKVPPPARP